jgi:hypothetical protein
MIEDKMTDLSECHHRMLEKGYTLDFKITEEGLTFPEAKKVYKPEEVNIVNYFRFEGISDPDDMEILYVMETNDGKKGTLVDAFGPYADPHVAKFLIEVENIHKKIAKNNNITSPVKQAPLESRVEEAPRQTGEAVKDTGKYNTVIDEKTEVRKGSGAGVETCVSSEENKQRDPQEQHADGIWGIQNSTLQTISHPETEVGNNDTKDQSREDSEEKLKKAGEENQKLVRGFDDNINRRQ